MKTVRKFLSYWLRIAKPIANFQARVLFTIFYFVLFVFVGLPMRLFSDPLRLYQNSFKKRSAFTSWEHKLDTQDEARKPF